MHGKKSRITQICYLENLKFTENFGIIVPYIPYSSKSNIYFYKYFSKINFITLNIPSTPKDNFTKITLTDISKISYDFEDIHNFYPNITSTSLYSIYNPASTIQNTTRIHRNPSPAPTSEYNSRQRRRCDDNGLGSRRSSIAARGSRDVSRGPHKRGPLNGGND